jgi:hypothetical protein
MLDMASYRWSWHSFSRQELGATNSSADEKRTDKHKIIRRIHRRFYDTHVAAVKINAMNVPFLDSENTTCGNLVRKRCSRASSTRDTPASVEFFRNLRERESVLAKRSHQLHTPA